MHKLPSFAEQYNLGEYLIPTMMGVLDAGEAPDDLGMAHLYNCMDVFVLPTAGEGFGIPTIEAMSCGVPICVTNYTTGYELIKSDIFSTILSVFTFNSINFLFNRCAMIK